MSDDNRRDNEKEHFHSLNEIVEYYAKNGVVYYIFYDRESGENQHKNKNAKSRKPLMLKIIEEFFEEQGVRCFLIGSFYENASGWSDCLEGRSELAKAIQMAKKHNAVLIAPSPCRIVRSGEHSHMASLQNSDFEQLAEFIGRDIVIATIIPPGTSFKNCTKEFSQWGQKCKGKNGGRPREKYSGYTIHRRESCLRQVIRWRKQGVSYRKIAKMIFDKFRHKVCKTTIFNWVKKDGKK